MKIQQRNGDVIEWAGGKKGEEKGEFYACRTDKFRFPTNIFILTDRTKPAEVHDE